MLRLIKIQDASFCLFSSNVSSSWVFCFNSAMMECFPDLRFRLYSIIIIPSEIFANHVSLNISLLESRKTDYFFLFSLHISLVYTFYQNTVYSKLEYYSNSRTEQTTHNHFLTMH